MHKTKAEFHLYRADIGEELTIPLFKGGLRAGFPSPAGDYIEDSIDLNKELIEHPSCTFFGIVEGDSMDDVNIHDGDLAIIDCSIDLSNKKLIEGKKFLCCLDGEYTIKFIKFDSTDKNVIWLMAGNKKYKPIKVSNEQDFKVYGFISYTITPHLRKF